MRIGDLAVLELSLIAMSFVNGCSTTKEETTQDNDLRAYDRGAGSGGC
jgi:hypothetical protein